MEDYLDSISRIANLSCVPLNKLAPNRMYINDISPAVVNIIDSMHILIYIVDEY